jgi:hypothetical protein
MKLLFIPLFAATAFAIFEDVVAQNVPAPVSPAKSLQIVREWDGPFAETKIFKVIDADDGVACYLYFPSHVPTSTVCSGKQCGLQYPAGIGSISCVKVKDANGVVGRRQ